MSRAVGPLDESIIYVRRFRKGLVVQIIFQLEDSFDIEGMEEAKRIHDETYRSIHTYILEDISFFGEILPLNARKCKFCSNCTYPEELAYRFPDIFWNPMEST